MKLDGTFLKGLLTLLKPTLLELFAKLLSGGIPAGAAQSPQALEKLLDDHIASL